MQTCRPIFGFKHTTRLSAVVLAVSSMAVSKQHISSRQPDNTTTIRVQEACTCWTQHASDGKLVHVADPTAILPALYHTCARHTTAQHVT